MERMPEAFPAGDMQTAMYKTARDAARKVGLPTGPPDDDPIAA